MKTKYTLLFVFGLLFTISGAAQHREFGFISNASMGIMYGPVLDARPVLKWGKKFESVNLLRMERSYVNYSKYQGNPYWYTFTGVNFGHEWRKPITDKIYYAHGPEVGLFYSGSNTYATVQPTVRYQYGLLYRINDHFNIGLSAPISLTTSFSKSNGEWNSSAVNFGMFSDPNYLILTYAFEKQKK
jgi:hypothetical protein